MLRFKLLTVFILRINAQKLQHKKKKKVKRMNLDIVMLGGGNDMRSVASEARIEALSTVLALGLLGLLTWHLVLPPSATVSIGVLTKA